MKNKVLLVDGTLLLFKKYYGISKVIPDEAQSNLVTSNFILSIFSAIEQFNISYVMIAFDTYTSKNKRLELWSDYKANRTKAPDKLFEQMDLIKKILKVFNILVLESEDDEADDIIATLTRKSKIANSEVYIYSSDKDLLQLVDNHVSIVDFKNNEVIVKDINNFYDTYGINPNQIVDFKGIAGDDSDNLPGVSGIGQKTAVKLLNSYGTLEGIYNNLDKLTKSQQNKFIASQEIAFLSKSLAKLNDQVKLNLEYVKKYFGLKLFWDTNIETVLTEHKLNRVKNKWLSLLKIEY